MMLTVTALHIFPVKSLGGISVYAWPVELRGFKHDRRWMVIDAGGNFLTQREIPQLARIGTEIIEDKIFVFDKRNPKDYCMLPLELTSGAEVKTNVWQFESVSLAGDAESEKWISEKTGQPCRFVFMPDVVHRQVDLTYAREGDQTNFSDGYPVLLCNQASLDDLNTKLAHPVGMIRFRPNLVVAGAQPWEEDVWKEIEIGKNAMRVVKPCGRCVITTNDPETGIMSKEPLKTLASFRTMGHRIVFGQNCIPENAGMIKVGDVVSVK